MSPPNQPPNLYVIPKRDGAIAFGTVATREPSRVAPSRPSRRVSTIAALWTTDELIWACFFTGLASVLVTCVAALIWGAL